VRDLTGLPTTACIATARVKRIEAPNMVRCDGRRRGAQG
jgi:hypothetical protein